MASRTLVEKKIAVDLFSNTGTLIGPNRLSYETTAANIPNTQVNLMKMGRRGREQKKKHDAIHNNPHSNILPKDIFISGLKPTNNAYIALITIRDTAMREGKTTSVQRKVARTQRGEWESTQACGFKRHFRLKMA